MGTIAGPVGAAIGASIGVILAVASMFKGCGQTCIAATHIVDQVGAQLVEMFNAYMNAPVHYQSMQTAYLQAWDAFWQSVVQACGDPSLGQAGVNCVADRQQGACHYHTSPGGWSKDANGNWKYVAPGANGSGKTCWDWFVGTRDPVAQDPTVVPDPTPTSTVASIANSVPGLQTAETILSNITSGGISPLLLIGGAALLGFVMLSRKKRKV